MTRALPAVSVIVPTRNAPPILGRTLANLANQTLPPHRYEVIVVTGEDVADAWQHAPAERQYDLRVYSQEGPGAARRRNAGAAHARGELLVFLDDDMAAEPGLLAAHVAAHEDAQHGAQGDGGGLHVVMGYLPPRLTLAGEDRRAARVEMDLRDWWEDTFREMARPGHRFGYTDLLSGNFSLGKAAWIPNTY
jgi:glycosyltransferase involved in cell wall biosynthesis